MPYQPIYPAIQRGTQTGAMLGKNALAMRQLEEQEKRKQGLRNILSQAYQPSVPTAISATPAAPGQGEMQPGKLDLQKAYGMMFEQGLGPEALEMQQEQQELLSRKGTLPATIQEWQAMQTMTPEEKRQFMLLKRGQQTAMIGGVLHYQDPVTQEWEPMSTLQEEIEAKTETEKAKGLGVQAAATVKTGLEQAQKIGENIQNLNEVIRIVDEEGASTGPLISKMPSFRASAVQLDNMRRRLGLDVIGSVTFGALSEAELNMALDTALPTGLGGPELIQWAKDKISAQSKLKKYLEDQAIYLSKPGNTVAGWIEEQRATSADGEYKVGQVVTGLDGNKYVIRTLKADGTPDDVEPVK